MPRCAQAVTLEGLAVYLDAGAAFLAPPARPSGPPGPGLPPGPVGDRWSGLPIYVWDAVFLPARHKPGTGVHSHAFLLAPVSGAASYVRRRARPLIAKLPARAQSCWVAGAPPHSRPAYGCC
jgi:hypothetical protein